MKNLTSSATKIVLLVVISVLSIITLYAVILSVWRGSMDAKDVLTLFGYVMTSVISFYFGNKTPTDTGAKSETRLTSVTTLTPQE